MKSLDGVKISMGAYDEPTENCPYCGSECEADWVDVGVGSVQCAPYHCESCGSSEIGPELSDWDYKDREGKIICTQSKRKYYSHLGKKISLNNDFRNTVLRYDAPFTEDEIKKGWYRGKISPYANTVGGQLVDHETAKELYNLGLLDDKRP